jgi:hypothetical protein
MTHAELATTSIKETALLSRVSKSAMCVKILCHGYAQASLFNDQRGKCYAGFLLTRSTRTETLDDEDDNDDSTFTTTWMTTFLALSSMRDSSNRRRSANTRRTVSTARDLVPNCSRARV